MSTAATSVSTSGPAAAATVTGSGSTFDAPFFEVAFAKYHLEHPAVTISYSAVGSSAGIAAFSAKQADFGATDVPLTAAEQAAARGGPSVQVPVDLGAEVVVYNLNLPGPSRLHLTGPVIARIFLGQITSWRDPAIVALNPNIDIPGEPITVVHRADGSGTTYIFSNYLSSVDPAWASEVGTGKSLHWPAGVGANGNPGVAQAVSHIPFSIGYIERSYSHAPVLAYAAIRNQAGQYTTPSMASIAASAAQKPGISPANFSIVDIPASGRGMRTG
jgi:phosphate transport system substrate-binding protein